MPSNVQVASAGLSGRNSPPPMPVSSSVVMRWMKRARAVDRQKAPAGRFADVAEFLTCQAQDEALFQRLAENSMSDDADLAARRGVGGHRRVDQTRHVNQVALHNGAEKLFLVLRVIVEGRLRDAPPPRQSGAWKCRENPAP